MVATVAYGESHAGQGRSLMSILKSSEGLVFVIAFSDAGLGPLAQGPSRTVCETA